VTRLAIIRHGETQWNVAGRIQGQSDSPLTPGGEETVRGWAKTLGGYDFSALYASPLGRAMRTAELVGAGLGLAPVPKPGLEEQAFGEWTGGIISELRASGELSRQEALGWAFTPPGGEDRQTVLLRAWKCLLELAQRHAGQSILAVTHEGVIRAVLYALKGRDYLPSEPKIIAPRSLHVLRAHGGCLRIEDWNLSL
jgi:probable phosphoglycerate mutase